MAKIKIKMKFYNRVYVLYRVGSILVLVYIQSILHTVWYIYSQFYIDVYGSNSI